MAQIHALTPEGRLPTAATGHVEELIYADLHTTYEWVAAPHASESVKRESREVVDRNLILDPSFEEGVADVAVGAGVTAHHSSFNAVSGGYTLQLDFAGVSGSQGYAQKAVALPDGSAGGWLAVSSVQRRNTLAGPTHVTCWVSMRNGSGEIVSSFRGYYPVTDLAMEDQPRTTWAMEIPAGATLALVRLRFNGGDSSTAPADGSIRTDAWKVSVGDSEADALARAADYFDGDTPDKNRLDTITTPEAPIRGVEGVGVQRIIASTNPDHPVLDGDLLIVLKNPIYFNDFSQYQAGVAPHDWSQPWEQSSGWVVVEDGGRKILRMSTASSGRRLLTWDPTDQKALTTRDVEMVFKWRTPTESAGARAVLLATGSAGAETGMFGGHNSSAGGIRLGRYLNGTSAFGGDSTAYPWVADQWYITRLRTVGGAMTGRTWAASDPEPQAWGATADASVMPEPGRVGLFAFGAARQDFDWVSVAFDGATARKGA